MADPSEKAKHKRPSKEQMDERVSAPLTPEELAEGLLRTGPHPEDDQPATGNPSDD